MSLVVHSHPVTFESFDSTSTTIVKTEYDESFDFMMFSCPARETFPQEPCRATIPSLPYHMSATKLAVACAIPNSSHSLPAAIQPVLNKYDHPEERRLHLHHSNTIMAGSHQPLYEKKNASLGFDVGAEQSVYPIRQSIEKDDEPAFGETNTPADGPWTWTGYVKHPESSERSSLKREAERLREARGGHLVRVERAARIRVRDT